MSASTLVPIHMGFGGHQLGRLMSHVDHTHTTQGRPEAMYACTYVYTYVDEHSHDLQSWCPLSTD